MMSLYEGTKTRDRVDFEISEEFDVIVRMHHGSVLSPFVAGIVDIKELARDCVLSELLCAEYLALVSEIIEVFWIKSMKWRAFG